MHNHIHCHSMYLIGTFTMALNSTIYRNKNWKEFWMYLWIDLFCKFIRKSRFIIILRIFLKLNKTLRFELTMSWKMIPILNSTDELKQKNERDWDLCFRIYQFWDQSMTKAINFAMKREHFNVIFELPRQYFDSTI